MQRLRRSRRKVPFGTPCGYCFQEWATVYDHINPFCFSFSNHKDNLYPSCARCNGLLGSLIFDTLEQKREYVREKLIQRGEWQMPSAVQQDVSQEAEMAEALLSSLPVGEVGREAPPDLSPRPCKTCGELLTPKTRQHIYCSQSCSNEPKKRLKHGKKKAIAKLLAAL